MVAVDPNLRNGEKDVSASLELPRPWGTATRAWDQKDIERWWLSQVQIRSYAKQVLARINQLPASIQVEKYGPYNQIFRRIKVGSWDSTKPKILVTGGVHGYEIGGVDAALTFAERYAAAYTDRFDFAIFPCVNPFAFERDLRWNSAAQDTNRHFSRDIRLTESGKSAPECVAFMDSVDEIDVGFALHIDCHETTDKDLELRALKMYRDGKTGAVDRVIPQGFYLVMNEGDRSSIGQAVIESVRMATKVADESIVLGLENKGGVVYLDSKSYPGLCMNYTNAPYKITTEVYPDIITPQEALAGQLAAINGAINYLSNNI